MKISPKIEKITTTAKELFIKYGIKRVSIKEICSASNVSKMTFYRHFKSKNDLVKFILKEIFSQGRNEIDEVLALDLPFEEKMKKILLLKIEYSNKYSPEFLSEFILSSDPEIKKFVDEENAKSFIQLKQIFSNAQKNYEIRPDIKIELIMFIASLMRDIFQNKNLNKLYPDTSSLMVEAFSFFYYGILTKK